ncbi:uncharacterized protein GGS22DRAFT_152039 [Annulohypoxylon maeteangense]|uniref:uncharacterized protein n=1 Tax=Annulohypoxylon maeteangense TaxID=1927788 RepID=UPI002008E1F8|nr:uncharacterized protein GGS22DRAFT_152039 [Annulohypoxylon maeteangense]KAI0888643.1 hypothetical protein GGS22DRAFT_152039 [Annulohypoxylon maeteangense]
MTRFNARVAKFLSTAVGYQSQARYGQCRAAWLASPMFACLLYVLLTYVAAYPISCPASDAVMLKKDPVGSIFLVILLKTYIRETINHMLSYPKLLTCDASYSFTDGPFDCKGLITRRRLPS